MRIRLFAVSILFVCKLVSSSIGHSDESLRLFKTGCEGGKGADPGAIVPKENLLVSALAQAQSAAKPSVITRTGWSCADGANSPLWTPQYTTVSHLIVHHSATANSSSDWKAEVRSIWQYHTFTQGWGDIGYNYLIDPNGVIYEGRAGGDNVIGAHFSCQNGGTFGVCLLGTFTSVAPTTSALSSLKQLLAWKAAQRGIDPQGSTFHSGTHLTLSNISGHRNGNPAYPQYACSSTECPGDILYSMLPSIRTDVQNLIAGPSQQPAMSLNYNGTAIPSGDQSPTSTKGTDFGTVTYGLGSVTRTFTISNSGSAALNITGGAPVQIGGANASDFAVRQLPSTPVNVGSTTTFKLEFYPTVTEGIRTAVITIANNDPNHNPYTFAVQGTVQRQQTVSPSLDYNGQESGPNDQSPTIAKGTDFGTVDLAQSATHNFKFYNYGNINLTLTGAIIQLSGANASDFAIVSTPNSPIVPNGYSTIGIRFQPTAGGTRTANLLVYFDATYAPGITSPYTVALQGTGRVADPALISPTPGSQLSSSTVTFQWTAGAGVDAYWLYVGTAVGTNDLYANDLGLNLSTRVPRLPVDGRTLYVRLWWHRTAGWQTADYTYKSGGTIVPSPTISAFTVSPTVIPTGGSSTISYTVADAGGPGLKRVELWQFTESSGQWSVPQTNLHSGISPVTGSFSRSLSQVGNYFFGIHVVDQDGDTKAESDFAFSATKVVVSAGVSLSVIANPSNGGVVTGQGTFAVGSLQTISATANAGWTFTGWNDGNTQTPRTVTVPAGGATYTATFVQMPTLTVAASPSNGGVVTGQGSFAVGSQQTISATANAGWTFTGWNDGNTQTPRTITVPAGGATYTATFVQMATLSVVANPSTGGSVTGQGTFAVGSQQTISATANAGWTFTGWNDGNTQTPRTVTVPAGGATYTAAFVPMATLTVVASPSNGGVVTGQGTFAVGSQQTISATANVSWTFTGWNDGNTQTPRTVTVQSGGATYTANFAAIPDRPSNDDFANRLALGSISVQLTGQNTNATKEAGEPNHAKLSGGRSVWWSWTPASSGTATFSTLGSSFDTLLGIYTGTTVSTLTLIANNDDADLQTSTSLVTVPVSSGTEYQIAVDGYGGSFGVIRLSVSLESSPDRPSLKTSRSNNEIVLSWDVSWAGFILESAKTLAPGAAWDLVSPPPVISGTLNVSTNLMGKAALFYRLRRP